MSTECEGWMLKDPYRAYTVGEPKTSWNGALSRRIWIDEKRKWRGRRTVLIGSRQCKDENDCQAWVQREITTRSLWLGPTRFWNKKQDIVKKYNRVWIDQRAFHGRIGMIYPDYSELVIKKRWHSWFPRRTKKGIGVYFADHNTRDKGTLWKWNW